MFQRKYERLRAGGGEVESMEVCMCVFSSRSAVSVCSKIVLHVHTYASSEYHPPFFSLHFSRVYTIHTRVKSVRIVVIPVLVVGGSCAVKPTAHFSHTFGCNQKKYFSDRRIDSLTG